MGGIIKKIISLLIGVPAFMIFAGETSNEYFWIQIVAAFVLVVVFMWNFWGMESDDRQNNINYYKHTSRRSYRGDK